jgi:putative transposase
MQEDTVVGLPRPGGTVEDDPLLAVLREGARQMLTHAIEAEVAAFLAVHADEVDEEGRRRLVRHGHAPKRVLQTGIGPIEVRRPRVRDRGADDESNRIRFTSAVLPAYLRRARNVEELLPWLYLKGISTGQFEDALTVLLGPDAPGLSAATIRRLVSAWQEEHQRWQGRDLSAKRYVYVWADGIYFAPRLEHARQCMLVLIGADAGGKKELLALDDGFRESEQSWHELLVRLRDQNGLVLDPELATGDGALGFWQAARKVWPTVRAQRCWVHKTANVLNYLPKSVQTKAKADLHAIYEAASRAGAEAAFDRFLAKYQAKYDKAAGCLAKDREALLAFYDFPAEHWVHLRTTNPIESTFATVRNRSKITKGPGSRAAGIAMAYKLIEAAQSRWRAVNAPHLVALVRAGAKFENGKLLERPDEPAAEENQKEAA